MGQFDEMGVVSAWEFDKRELSVGDFSENQVLLLHAYDKQCK